MFDTREKPQMVERAFLIGVYFDRADEERAQSLLEELTELVTTLGIGIVGKQCIFVRNRNKRYLTGTGKAEEMIDEALSLESDCIIFDNELSPSQQRTWEEDSSITVLDREEVILDIFKMRAQTKEARLQVELARMQYSLPRLARMWTHLDRQGGGGGGGGKGAARGEGEQQIEVDRRLARKRIDRIKSELEDVRRNRETQRKQRSDEGIGQASIVGYTNAGKSSLLNALAGADVLAEDKLFATLDPTTRRLELPDGQPLLMTDTVGFVRNLPHRLVEAFKATLEEAILADFLVHVLDASSQEIFSFYETTVSVLKELGAAEKPTVLVLNKMDLVADDEERVQELKAHFGEDAVFLSVATGEGMDALIGKMSDLMVDRVARLKLRIPQARQDVIALLHREAKILSTDYEGNDVLLTSIVPHALRHRVEKFEPAAAE
ncbi:GTPase HflX [Verrucomicrobiales bacterium]|jgi:GTP-binding protein HflX|nr:GTPase HflX [Verrucomicrobiales bacterium]MDA9923994.1 GTPase HflX [Verrucomicrobiales bacterium]MDB2642413.1 GTPase HflX [bacterium]MDB3941264.1 GTPase HflX [Verrucomicrobiales bacterium]MDC0263227.1 GTPase HflX [Verrucomicrobiales bacterium]